jgi:hypothetical protein
LRRVLSALATLGFFAFPAVAHATASYSVTPAAIDYGNVTEDGHAASQVIVITNTSTAGEKIYVDGATWQDIGKNPVHEGWSGITSCDYQEISPGQQCGLTMAFKGILPDGLHTNAVVLPIYGVGIVPCSWNPAYMCDGPLGTSTVALQGNVVAPTPPPAQDPPLAVTGAATLSLRTFYPFVVDGYRDAVTYTVGFNEAATGTVSLYNRYGALVRRWPFSGVTSAQIRWAGRNRFGRMVRPGQFTFQVTASHTDSGNGAVTSVHSGLMRVRAKTAFVYTTHSRTTSGHVGAHYAAGRCPQRRVGVSWSVNCIGDPPSSGVVTYRHTFPRNAVRGTRRLAEIWFRSSWAEYHGRPRFGRTWTIGRTVYQNVVVPSQERVRFTKVRWTWKTRRRI